MKKKKADGNSFSPAVRPGHGRDARLKSAIETVFRLTHSREMTAKERHEFGVNNSTPNHKQPGATKSSRLRTPQLEPSELS